MREEQQPCRWWAPLSLSMQGASRARLDSFEDLPGKWQAAILKAEQNRPNLKIVAGA
jgi:hypothetical protein